MGKPLQFRVSSAIKDIVGRDLITDDFIAVFELVKNSYDAHASEVKLIFKDLNSDNAKIIIKDNGKGMNYKELVDKWLVLAYSAKKEGTEDDDYREKINRHRAFAGAKGIGRFSCDRLGKRLQLITAKKSEDRAHILVTNWELFERDMKEDFIDVSVEYSSRNKESLNIKRGTILEITELRSDWTRKRILQLKDSLAKLINPNEASDNKNNFSIIIEAEEELDADSSESEYFKIVNGEVKNFVFEALGLKTTKIQSSISPDGKKIVTELHDGGMLIYKLTEKNPYKAKINSVEPIKNIKVVLYYLNQAAKNSFTRLMGVQAVNYGTVFLYRNGFRIYPFGEPAEDTLGIDKRKQQGYARFLGTRELIGRIEIKEDTDNYKETSSRDGGLVKNKAYLQLIDYFYDKALKRLERYVVDVQQWGSSVEEDLKEVDREVFNSKMMELLAKVSDEDQILDVEFNDNILEIVKNVQNDSAIALAGKLKSIAAETNNDKLAKLAKDVERKLSRYRLALDESEKREDEERGKAIAAIENKQQIVSENLFLRSIKSQDFEEVVSLLHHVGIYAGTIDNYLSGIYIKLQKGESIPKSDLENMIRSISLELSKISNISKFATKANFKLKTELLETNVGTYLQEYIRNVIPTVIPKGIRLRFQDENPTPLIKKIRPIELNIIIDNLVSNSKKAQAKNILVRLRRNKNYQAELIFSDDGKGIPDEDLNKIFDFGFTTTSGSGIGLYHVKKMIDSIGWKINVESKPNISTSFIIQIN